MDILLVNNLPWKSSVAAGVHHYRPCVHLTRQSRKPHREFTTMVITTEPLPDPNRPIQEHAVGSSSEPREAPSAPTFTYHYEKDRKNARLPLKKRTHLLKVKLTSAPPNDVISTPTAMKI
ncbi:hypothetical protein CAPTEDRAFT_190873 [Capitella teleta]|uniref:Uncharacterized protein n=1 Tax=Capitella teleta TaxID=283909 RepID=R7TS69_CAPTE|nr:hypothetical protein CAPTEDRAFT_189667 [Capitella teleta]ELU06065.1 hypothetical protein CAPTEDRAFT_190873 [Capitella teleta]|eukprot:ELT94311.1 hypothetical protein CAPTEDRAFT_189667 [Capitella teleta]